MNIKNKQTYILVYEYDNFCTASLSLKVFPIIISSIEHTSKSINSTHEKKNNLIKNLSNLKYTQLRKKKKRFSGIIF